MSEIRRVFSYIRVSGTSQVDGDGPDRQRDAINAFCDAHGLTVAGSFHDLAVRGATELEGRDGFRALLNELEATRAAGFPVFAIVVERLDRLARDLMVSELILAECRKRGIALLSVDQGAVMDLATNDADPTRKLIRQFMGAIAEWEKSVIVKKLRVARDRVRAERGYCEGPKPYGLTAIEAEVRAFILSRRAVGAGYGTIAKELRERNITFRGGKQWTKFLVRNVCKRSNPLPVLAQGPTIVDASLIDIGNFRYGVVE